MNKLKKWILLLLWMLIIFLFSNQPHSGTITHNMIKTYVSSSDLVTTLNFIIRKSAHVMEYLILFLLTHSLLKEYQTNSKKIIVLSLIFCFLYACSDEYHQSLVPGRTSQFKDVIIDITTPTLITSIYLLSKNTKTSKKSTK